MTMLRLATIAAVGGAAAISSAAAAAPASNCACHQTAHRHHAPRRAASRVTVWRGPAIPEREPGWAGEPPPYPPDYEAPAYEEPGYEEPGYPPPAVVYEEPFVGYGWPLWYGGGWYGGHGGWGHGWRGGYGGWHGGFRGGGFGGHRR